MVILVRQPSPGGGLQRLAGRQPAPRRRAETRGFLMVELLVAMAILMIALLPLAYSSNLEARFFRSTYQQAVALEIADGEMEILAAGAWRALPEGTHPYPVAAPAVRNLPDGQFQITRTGNNLRLEWVGTNKPGIGRVVREVTVK